MVQPDRLALPRPAICPPPVMATESLPLSGLQKRHNRLGNDDPDLVGIVRGMGTEDRGRALAGRTGPLLAAST
jgi:hypothetical protein